MALIMLVHDLLRVLADFPKFALAAVLIVSIAASWSKPENMPGLVAVTLFAFVAVLLNTWLTGTRGK